MPAPSPLPLQCTDPGPPGILVASTMVGSLCGGLSAGGIYFFSRGKLHCW